MQHYSEEYLDKLVAEHRLVSATIVHIQADWNRIARNHTGTAASSAVSNLLAKKVELEGMIDVLREYLTG